MIYILIVMWFGQSASYSGKAAISVEFNSLEACQAAAKSIKQQSDTYAQIGTIVCAAKGDKLK